MVSLEQPFRRRRDRFCQLCWEQAWPPRVADGVLHLFSLGSGPEFSLSHDRRASENSAVREWVESPETPSEISAGLSEP